MKIHFRVSHHMLTLFSIIPHLPLSPVTGDMHRVGRPFSLLLVTPVIRNAGPASLRVPLAFKSL